VVPPGVATHALSEPVQRDVWVYWRGSSDPLIRSLITSASADAG
jgi:hypothetical protein